MNEHTDNAIVNREEPIPVIKTPSREAGSSDSDSKRQKLKESLSRSKLGHRLKHAVAPNRESGAESIQDRLFAK